MRALYLFGCIWISFCLINPALAKHRNNHRHLINQMHIVRLTRPRAVASAITGPAQLNSELNAIVNSDSTAAIAVFVKSMKFEDTLYTRNIDHPLTPASTMKVLTAEAGLIYLGTDYRFSTQLLTNAKTVKNGVLQGNLYVVLSGDPTLTYNDVLDLMQSLKDHQIQGVAGNVYIDDTAYDQTFYGPGWEWKDKNYCYAAPISAGIINHNCLPFRVSPGTGVGRTAQVETYPKFFYPAIKNTVVTKASHTHACSLHLSSTLTSGLEIDGCMPAGRYAWGLSYVVTDVPDYNRALFKGVLDQLGINIYGTVTFGSAPENLSMVGSHTSKPLKLLINEMLKKSDNVIAGALFKKIGQLYTHRQGTWDTGSLAVSEILAKHAGMNLAGLRILDGSGLSPANLTTPAQMMQVLDYAYHNSATSFEFISALPIAGIDGTLKHRMGNIARKVRAKTGTITGVTTLVGYAVSSEQEPLAFVIMINGNRGMGWHYKELEDKIATALTRYKRTV